MSNLDLSKAGDFQRATLGAGAAILQTIELAGRDPAKWDLKEASYNGKLFHVFVSKSPFNAALSKVQDQGGRRKAKYLYPYVDGQTTDDLGRKPETFTVDVMIFGNRYLEGFAALLEEFNKPTPGDFVHPVRGTTTCVVEDYSVTHAHESRKCVQMTITFTEHNFTIGKIELKVDKSVKGALSTALGALADIDAFLTKITGAVVFAKSLRNQIQQAVTEYQQQFRDNLVNMNRTFNNRGSADIPGLVPANLGGLSGDRFEVVESPTQSIDVAQAQKTANTALAVEQIKKDVITSRQTLKTALDLIEGGNNGQGSLEFYDEIVDLKQTAIDLQTVLERGIASSQNKVINYMVPHTMSLREAAFLNGLSVNDAESIEILNPELLSTNFVEKGSIIRVPKL